MFELISTILFWWLVAGVVIGSLIGRFMRAGRGPR